MSDIAAAPLMRRYVSRLVRSAGTRRMATAVLLVLVGACLEGVGLTLLVPLIERLDHRPGLATPSWLASLNLPDGLPVMLAAFVALVALRAVVVRKRDLVLLALRLTFVDTLRLELQSALAATDWRTLSRLGHADVTQVLVADLGRVNQGTIFLLQWVASLTMGIAGIAVALHISPLLTWITLGLALSSGLLVKRRLRAALAMGSSLSVANRNFLRALSDFLNGLKIIKASATEPAHMRRFAQEAATLRRQQLEFTTSQANARAWFEVLVAAILSGLLWVAYTFIQLDVARLLIIVAVFTRLLPMIRDWHSQVQQLMYMLPAYDAYEQWLARCKLSAEPLSSPGLPMPLREALTLDGVSYRHDEHGRGLEHVSIRIPARQTTAVTGPSGAGKTTLADLILGLLVAQQGVMQVDGQPLTPDRLRDWRQSMAYVPQDPFLFPDSIRNNLRLFKAEASDDAIWAALEQASARSFVEALPQGLDTQVGAQGSNMSGGERQRLALARALLARPQLLVLDEATSHLDVDNERRIQAALAALHGQMTVVLIAHRLSTVRHADQIIVMDKGQVVQSGPWDTLAHSPGPFQRMLSSAAA
jgi:ABC-type multidrug transport system fused ATPase/permease subunit